MSLQHRMICLHNASAHLKSTRTSQEMPPWCLHMSILLHSVLVDNSTGVNLFVQLKLLFLVDLGRRSRRMCLFTEAQAHLRGLFKIYDVCRGCSNTKDLQINPFGSGNLRTYSRKKSRGCTLVITKISSLKAAPFNT